jgi:hypothetical protein
MEWWLDAPGFALITTMLASSQLVACGPPTPVGLALLRFLSLALRDLLYIHKMITMKIVQCMKCKVQYDACTGAT